MQLHGVYIRDHCLATDLDRRMLGRELSVDRRWLESFFTEQ